MMNNSQFKTYLLQQGKICRRFWLGEYIFREGEYRQEVQFIFIDNGIVKLTSINDKGKEFNLNYSQGPILFSTVCLYTGKSLCTYNLEVVSKEVEAYILTQKEMKSFVEKDTQNAFYMVSTFQNHLTYNLAKLNDFSANGKLGALCGQLLILSYRYGVIKARGIEIKIGLTLEELGCASGVFHSSAVSRILSKLKSNKVLELNRTLLLVTNLDYLREMAPKIDEWFYCSNYEQWAVFNEQEKAL